MKLENAIPPPVVGALFSLLMWGVSWMTPGLPIGIRTRLLACTVLFALGAFFAIAGVVSFRRARTTVNPLKPESASALVQSGIYRFSRNPMYVGFVLFLLAWAVFLASAWALLGVAGFVLYMNRFQIAPEERALRALFGAEFDRYRAGVRRWL